MKCTNITSYFYLNVNLYFSWAQHALTAVSVPSLFLFMGTACAYCGDCALLVPFRGHSVRLLRWLYPPCFFSWAQHALATVSVPSLFHFMGTACAYCGDCAHVRLRQAQTAHIHKKQCPDHIFPDPGTVLYNLLNFLTLRRWHYRCTTGNICPSGR